MPTWINKATVYILGWFLYNTQGIILPHGTIWGQLLVFSLILVSLYYAYIANVRYRLTGYFVGLNILIAFFSVYGAFLLMTYDPAEYNVFRDPSIYLKKIYISLLPIYAFYVFFKEKYINEKMLYFFIFVFFLEATGNFFHHQRMMVLHSLVGHNGEGTNNYGYAFLSLIPMCVYLYKKSLIQYIALGFCMNFLIMGMKRGAIIIGALCLLWFLWNNLKNASTKMKFSVLLLSVLLCIGAFFYVQYKMENSLYFQKRVEQTLEGNSSGRDKLYSDFVNYFLNDASPLQFAFGSGADATLKVSYNYAHNDWLEIAVNQGVLGIMIYILYWILFAKESLSKCYDPQVKMALQLLFIIYFMKTIFSMSYYSMTIPATFALGYCLSKKNVKDVSRI